MNFNNDPVMPKILDVLKNEKGVLLIPGGNMEGTIMKVDLPAARSSVAPMRVKI